LKFHNGDPVTTEDVKFSFERYQGTGAQTLKDHVSKVEIVDPLVVRFHLKEPWPDFMTFYGTTAAAAGIVVPKNYLTQIGDYRFKKHPVGTGPHKFVGSKPGIEVVVEADPGYWRRGPALKTLVMRSIPDATTRALTLKTGEADIAYALDGTAAEGIKDDDPGIKIVATNHASSQWIEFTEQWDAKSPWHDKRLRLAVNYALDRQAISDAVVSAFARRPGSSCRGSWSSPCRPSRRPTIPRKPSNCSLMPAIRTGSTPVSSLRFRAFRQSPKGS
jgi:peptide/nickel transport system substrate-binding protein